MLGVANSTLANTNTPPCFISANVLVKQPPLIIIIPTPAVVRVTDVHEIWIYSYVINVRKNTYCTICSCKPNINGILVSQSMCVFCLSLIFHWRFTYKSALMNGRPLCWKNSVAVANDLKPLWQRIRNVFIIIMTKVKSKVEYNELVLKNVI